MDAVTYSPVNASNPIAAGAYLGIYCTGLAWFPPSGVTVLKAGVLIDGQPANVLWSGLAPGFAGVNQVNVQVPATLPAGTHRLQIVVDGAASNEVRFVSRI